MAELDTHPHVMRAIEAANDHDAAAFAAEFADGGTFSDPVLDEGLTGAAIREYNAEAMEAFPDFHIEVKRAVTGTDGTVAIEWTIHGTHEGEFEGMPPTGNTVALPGVSVITVTDEGITSWRDYFDQRTFAEQLGLTFPAVIRQLPKLAWGKLQTSL